MKETRAIARKLQKQLQQLVPQAAEGEGGGSGTPTSSAEGTSENLHLAALMQRMQGSLVGDEGADGGGAGPSSAGADGEGAQVRLRDADWTAAEGGGTRNGGWGTGAPAATAAKGSGSCFPVGRGLHWCWRVCNWFCTAIDRSGIDRFEQRTGSSCGLPDRWGVGCRLSGSVGPGIAWQSFGACRSSR